MQGQVEDLDFSEGQFGHFSFLMSRHVWPGAGPMGGGGNS
jgi:hypothetical protein